MAKIVNNKSRSINPADDVAISKQRSLGMVTQADQDLRISRLESAYQQQEKPWSYINSPWYYRGSIPSGASGNYFTTIAMPTNTSTFGGVDQLLFVSPVSGYVVGCYLMISNTLTSGSVCGALSINNTVTHLIEDSRIFAGVAPTNANSALTINPTTGIPIARGTLLRPVIAASSATVASGVINAHIVLILAFKV